MPISIAVCTLYVHIRMLIKQHASIWLTTDSLICSLVILDASKSLVDVCHFSVGLKLLACFILGFWTDILSHRERLNDQHNIESEAKVRQGHQGHAADYEGRLSYCVSLTR